MKSTLKPHKIKKFIPYATSVPQKHRNRQGTISDGFGSEWSQWCPKCHMNSMVVMRPGEARCDICDN